MKDLEVKTYNFAVQGIGFAKSLEKEFPQYEYKELMKSAGTVSTKFIDALNAQENKDFADNLRQSYTYAKKSLEILNNLEAIPSDSLNKQKDLLIKDSEVIIEKLESIIKKLIY